MSGKNKIFNNKIIKECNFFKNKKLFQKDDIVNKILVSKKRTIQ